MLTRGQGRAQRKQLIKEIAAHDRVKQREELAILREAIRDARIARKQARAAAIERCRTARLEARARAHAMRVRALEELAKAIEAERNAARSKCETARSEAKTAKSKHARARAELAAERKYRREMRQIQRSAKQRHRELTAKQKRGEKQSESDDEVRGNIPPELVALVAVFNRVRRSIKASERMSRTEAFLHYAEKHPDEVLLVIGDRTDALIRELEEKQKRARRRPTRRELAADVPF
jgi:chromosome segregation ATPase